MLHRDDCQPRKNEGRAENFWPCEVELEEGGVLDGGKNLKSSWNEDGVDEGEEVGMVGVDGVEPARFKDKQTLLQERIRKKWSPEWKILPCEEPHLDFAVVFLEVSIVYEFLGHSLGSPWNSKFGLIPSVYFLTRMGESLGINPVLLL